MKKMTRLLISLGLASIMLSCSNLDFMYGGREFEYDTDWAAVYYRGADPATDSYQYRLMLVSGRTENLDLISSGAKVTLELMAPEENPEALPAGLYGPEGDHTINYGYDSKTPLNEVGVSYIEIKSSGSEKSVCYPVESGTVEVTVEPDGDYDIEASFEAAGCHMEFEYNGPLCTYNIGNMQI